MLYKINELGLFVADSNLKQILRFSLSWSEIDRPTFDM